MRPPAPAVPSQQAREEVLHGDLALCRQRAQQPLVELGHQRGPPGVRGRRQRRGAGENASSQARGVDALARTAKGPRERAVAIALVHQRRNQRVGGVALAAAARRPEPLTQGLVRVP